MKIINIISVGIALTMGAAIAEPNFRQDLNKNQPPKIEDYATFSFSLIEQQMTAAPHQAISISSDEYSIQVNGDDLMKGVDLPISQGDAIIRITQSSTKSGVSDIDMTLLKLDFASAEKRRLNGSAVQTSISKNQLASAGVFENTIALKTKSVLPEGPLQLKTEQALMDSDVYRISIKEKNSPIQFQLSAERQSFSADRQISFMAEMSNKSESTGFAIQDIFVLSPSGERLPVTFENKSKQAQINFSSPDDIISPINGLYELHVKSHATIDNLSVKRDAKIAFALSKPTASIKKVISSGHNRDHAKVIVDAKESSRYEIRAVLMGTNSNGVQMPIAEIHTAQTVNAGTQNIQINYAKDLIAKSGYSAPFTLTNVRLYDQKQLALIDHN
jgi:hypothetical protein